MQTVLDCVICKGGRTNIVVKTACGSLPLILSWQSLALVRTDRLRISDIETPYGQVGIAACTLLRTQGGTTAEARTGRVARYRHFEHINAKRWERYRAWRTIVEVASPSRTVRGGIHTNDL